MESQRALERVGAVSQTLGLSPHPTLAPAAFQGCGALTVMGDGQPWGSIQLSGRSPQRGAGNCSGCEEAQKEGPEPPPHLPVEAQTHRIPRGEGEGGNWEEQSQGSRSREVTQVRGHEARAGLGSGGTRIYRMVWPWNPRKVVKTWNGLWSFCIQDSRGSWS